MEDQKIIDLYWARSQQAISESEAKYGAYCRSIARGILDRTEDAEECVNDTWFRAWNAMPPQRPGILSAFFGKLTRNLSLDRWRRERAAKRGGSQVEVALQELEDCLPDRRAPEETLRLARRRPSSPPSSAASPSWTGGSSFGGTFTWSPSLSWHSGSASPRAS